MLSQNFSRVKMNKCNYIQPINPQVRFGVELKEIYPPWYLHPTLKNLIYLAEINIRNRHSARFDVELLIGKGNNGEGSVKQRLELKDRMICGKNILDVDVAPGVPIWLIRHFLGLLPTPIFPPKCDEHYWYNFSTRWYEQFIESIKKRTAHIELKDAVAFELSHLPGRNLTFLFELFELIRFLSMKSMCDDVVDKHAALLLVRYFTPSLIKRPYRPGILTKIDKKYFAFLLFTVHFWPELRIKIHDILTSSMNKNPDKFYYYPEIYNNKYSDNNFYLKDIGTQTESDSDDDLFLTIKSSSEESSHLDNHNTESKNKYLHDKLKDSMSINTEFTLKQSENELKTAISSLEQNTFVSSTPKVSKSKETNSPHLQNITQKSIEECYDSIRKNNCKFLQNTSIQTDINSEIANDIIPQNITPKLSVKINSRIKKRNRKKIPKSRDIVLLEIPYDKRKDRLKKIKIITYEKSTEKTCKINKRIPKQSNNETNTENLHKTKERPNCSAVTYGWNIDPILHNGEFIYDSYVGNSYDESPFKAKKLFSTPSHDFKLNLTPQLTPSVDLYKRITKYGWTYSKTPLLNTPVTEPYKLFYKAPSSNSSITEPSKFFYEADQRSLKSLNSETPLTENVKKKKGYSSFMKISSRLTFFKKFTSGKQETTKCSSCSDLNCNVKYEKISKSLNSI